VQFLLLKGRMKGATFGRFLPEPIAVCAEERNSFGLLKECFSGWQLFVAAA